MYNVFTVGVTYLNALWQAHRRGWSIVPSYVDALLDVQVCTSVMEPLAGEEGLTCIRAYLPTCLPVRLLWYVALTPQPSHPERPACATRSRPSLNGSSGTSPPERAGPLGRHLQVGSKARTEGHIIRVRCTEERNQC
jgi:hypothetical protein